MKIAIRFPNGKTIKESISKNAVTIGRSHKADLVITDEAISRIHCLIELQNGQFYITDFESGNGVYIDGNRIESQKKTPFNNFMQVSIGPVDCFVQDDEERELSLETVSYNINPPAPGKKYSRANPNRSPSRKKKKNEKLHKIIEDAKIVTAFILAFSAFIYFNKSEKTAKKETITAKRTSIPDKKPDLKKTAPLTVDDFSSIETYEQFNIKKSCEGMAKHCQEFKIENDPHEGIFVNESEVYVFFKPSKFFDQPRLNTYQNKEGAESFFSHFMVISSKLMNDLENKEIGQIHLILIGQDGKPIKVYRYHSSLFEQNKFNRSKTLEALGAAMRSKNIQEVLGILDSNIPFKDLSNTSL